MSKTNKGKAPSCRRAQQRNWAWCRTSNALGQLKALIHDADNVLLSSEKQELSVAVSVLEKFFKNNDNSTNWELKKAAIAKMQESQEQAEEY